MTRPAPRAQRVRGWASPFPGSTGPAPHPSSSLLQLVWLVRELVKGGVLGADGVCMTFMKQIAGESHGEADGQQKGEGSGPEQAAAEDGCPRTRLPLARTPDASVFGPRALGGDATITGSCLIFLPAVE